MVKLASPRSKLRGLPFRVGRHRPSRVIVKTAIVKTWLGLGTQLLRPAGREQFFHNLIKAKAGRLLTGRVVFEGRQEFADILLCGD